MNTVARYNLQKGIAENKGNNWTNYNIESSLDAYAVSKSRQRQRDREVQQQKALEEYISKLLEQNVESSLEKALKDVSKRFQ